MLFMGTTWGSSLAPQAGITLKLWIGKCSWDARKCILGWVINTITMTSNFQNSGNSASTRSSVLSHLPNVTPPFTSGPSPWQTEVHTAFPAGLTESAIHPCQRSGKLNCNCQGYEWCHWQLLLAHDWLYIMTYPDCRTYTQALVTEGLHDASNTRCGGVWFLSQMVITQNGYSHDPVLWHLCWLQQIQDALVLSKIVLIPSQTQIWIGRRFSGSRVYGTMFWCLRVHNPEQRWQHCNQVLGMKDQHLHQLNPILPPLPLHHQYIPCFDYLSLQQIPHYHWLAVLWFFLFLIFLILSLTVFLPQLTTLQVWSPSQKIVSSLISTLLHKQLPWESLLVNGQAHSFITAWHPGLLSPLSWPLIPYSLYTNHPWQNISCTTFLH